MPYSIEHFIFLPLFPLIPLYWCMHWENTLCKQPGLIFMDVVYVGLLYNWQNSGEKWRQTLKTPSKPFWLNNRGKNTTHFRCIFSILFTPIQIILFLWLHLRLLKKERLYASVYLWVCMSTLILLAGTMTTQIPLIVLRGSGQIGVDKNASYATMETCLLHSIGSALLSSCGTVQSYRVERHLKQSVDPRVSHT